MERSRLNTAEVEQFKRLAVEYRTLCESAAKFNDGRFIELSRIKLGHIQKWLCIRCEGMVDESRGVKSFLTKLDCRRIMEMVIHYAWNCWNIGDHMFPWEDAEKDDAKTKLEEYLDSLAAAEVPAMAAESR